MPDLDLNFVSNVMIEKKFEPKNSEDKNLKAINDLMSYTKGMLRLEKSIQIHENTKINE